MQLFALGGQWVVLVASGERPVDVCQRALLLSVQEYTGESRWRGRSEVIEFPCCPASVNAMFSLGGQLDVLVASGERPSDVSKSSAAVCQSGPWKIQPGRAGRNQCNSLLSQRLKMQLFALGGQWVVLVACEKRPADVCQRALLLPGKTDPGKSSQRFNV